MVFSSCQKCKECIPSKAYQNIEVFIGYEEVSIGWQMPNGNWIDPWDAVLNPCAIEIFETQEVYESSSIPNPRIEVCKDNFDSKGDYNNYINHLEEDGGYTCKSDFWN